MSGTQCVIVGGGLAGLACARELSARGRELLLLEASDGFGGRVRTDELEGFHLDRGFQVLLEAYPEARRVLDYEALDLRPFYPGALVRRDGRFQRFSDPLRAPLAAIRELAATRVISLGDRLRLLKLRRRASRGTLDELFSRPDQSIAEALRADGFSPTAIEAFFRPFLGGVFFDLELGTSSRLLEFVFRMFAAGRNSLPAEGMGAIPAQLAAGLPPGSLRTHSRVVEILDRGVRLQDGSELQAEAVVIATEGPQAARLLGGNEDCGSVAGRTLYFGAERTPIDEPILVLNGEGTGPLVNVVVPSRVAPHYAPPGAELVACTVLGETLSLPEADAEARTREALREWFGHSVHDWRHLRTYSIPHAQPRQAPGGAPPAHSRSPRPGLHLAGDWLASASIQGALVSGRKAAEAVDQELASA